MSEIVSFENFATRYGLRHGVFPPSYFSSQTREFIDYTPTIGEMGFFLDRGDIFQEHPWKNAVYHIPPKSQAEVFGQFMELRDEYELRVKPYLNIQRTGIGRKVELVSSYRDERGRPVIEGIMDESGYIQELRYLRRRAYKRRERASDEVAVFRQRRAQLSASASG